MVRPTVEEILAHPEFPTAIWKLQPTQSGMLPVANGRGGPFNICWEVHGTGDIKLVWIMGLAAMMYSWQRQTLEFGHEQGDKYSCLILDNRGMGRSDKPIMRYSTSEMAEDIIEVLEHIKWTAKQQLHVIGVSMGGMIAQEIAWLIPSRICSLSLISTAARIENRTTVLENLRTRSAMLIPKSLEQTIRDSPRFMVPESWLDAPDSAKLPTASTPGVILPPSGKYGKFNTNFERYVSQDLTKRLDKGALTRKGYYLQLIAAGWHYKGPAQLAEMGDKVGRERILVMHGTGDNMIKFYHAEVLKVELEPDVYYVKEGSGHVLLLEMTEWFNSAIETMVAKTEKMGKVTVLPSKET